MFNNVVELNDYDTSNIKKLRQWQKSLYTLHTVVKQERIISMN